MNRLSGAAASRVRVAGRLQCSLVSNNRCSFPSPPAPPRSSTTPARRCLSNGGNRKRLRSSRPQAGHDGAGGAVNLSNLMRLLRGAMQTPPEKVTSTINHEGDSSAKGEGNHAGTLSIIHYEDVRSMVELVQSVKSVPREEATFSDLHQLMTSELSTAVIDGCDIEDLLDLTQELATLACISAVNSVTLNNIIRGVVKCVKDFNDNLLDCKVDTIIQLIHFSLIMGVADCAAVTKLHEGAVHIASTSTDSINSVNTIGKMAVALLLSAPPSSTEEGSAARLALPTLEMRAVEIMKMQVDYDTASTFDDVSVMLERAERVQSLIEGFSAARGVGNDKAASSILAPIIQEYIGLSYVKVEDVPSFNVDNGYSLLLAVWFIWRSGDKSIFTSNSQLVALFSRSAAIVAPATYPPIDALCDVISCLSMDTGMEAERDTILGNLIPRLTQSMEGQDLVKVIDTVYDRRELFSPRQLDVFSVHCRKLFAWNASNLSPSQLVSSLVSVFTTPFFNNFV
jgi:hypothetical protein